MKIGIITGKSGETYRYEELREMIPKKYYKVNEYGEKEINTDIAIAFSIRHRFPNIKVDIIEPKDISLARLTKNDINYILGFDHVSALNESPYVKKYSGKQGVQKLDAIYKNPSSKVFPSFPFLSFIWDKKKYLQTLEKHNIPIIPTLFVKSNVSIPKLVKDIQAKKWKEFIIKPNGGTEKIGVEKFSIKDILNDNYDLKNYINTNSKLYNDFLLQPLINGFFKYGEIKTYWMNGNYSYAVNVRDQNTGTDGFIYDDLIRTTENIDHILLQKCIRIGEKAIEVIPKLGFNKKKVIPAMVRIDFAFEFKGNSKQPSKIYLNEIEHQDAGSLTENENVSYPYVEIMADTFVKKAREVCL